MKKTIYTFLVMLLVGGMVAMGQIKPIKRQNSTKQKTEKTSKPKQSSSSNDSGKSKKTSKVSTQQSSSHSSSSNTSPMSDRSSSAVTSTPIPGVVKQAINDLICVDGGTFTMGISPYKGGDDGPPHQVTINSFYIGRYEVTQELWLTVMGNNPSRYKGDMRRPVECVSWNDCQHFIKKLNQLTGMNFRLPTEAEWEYAARGGKTSKGYRFAGSDRLYNVAWYSDNSGSTPHTVGTRAPNELGIYDMSGNVFEWCQDWYGIYSNEWLTNPEGPSTGSDHVSRGGSWRSKWQGDASYCRVSSRFYHAPSTKEDNLGLRLALSIK